MTFRGESVVLVVDDNADVVSLMSRLIEYMGYPTLMANNGQLAVELALRHTKHLWCAVLDIGLPTIDGIEVAHKLRQIVPSLPIIFVTGYMPSVYTEQIMHIDRSILLTKPFQTEYLREALEQFAAKEK